ncbi:MAG TPA: hypothetical protein PKA42_03440 [Candidatus Paceibacterota bacterium]|nr:hypothetical protein [Candidatus Paceibacterota bacterium]HMO83196.1 hypothetical protein [Candidatus Paceibacterota bacterium]
MMEHHSIKDTSNTSDKGSKIFCVIVVGLLLIWLAYVNNWDWAPNQECAEKISFHPAGTEVIKSGLGSDIQTNTNTESYYSYLSKKFKTKKEAVSYCSKL